MPNGKSQLATRANHRRDLDPHRKRPVERVAPVELATHTLDAGRCSLVVQLRCRLVDQVDQVSIISPASVYVQGITAALCRRDKRHQMQGLAVSRTCGDL